LLLAAICIWFTGCYNWFTGCNNKQTDANSDRKAGVYLETGSDSGYIPGAVNSFIVVLPEEERKYNSTLILEVTRPSLLSDTVIAVQLEPQESASRKVQVTIPGNATSVIARVNLNWEYSPDMVLHSKPSTTYKAVYDLYESIYSKWPESLLEKITSNDDRSVTATLKLLFLMTKEESIRTPEHIEYVDSLIRQNLIGDEGLLLHLTLTLLTNRPQFDSLAEMLTSTQTGSSALDNWRFTELLMNSIMSNHLKNKRDEVLLFVTEIMAKYPGSTFTNNYTYVFRDHLIGKDYDNLVNTLISRGKTMPAMKLLVHITGIDMSLYSPGSLQRASNFVKGITDSIIALQKRYPGPKTSFEHGLWLQRQVTAYREINLLYHNTSDNSYPHPALAMMPTLRRSDTRVAGLASLVAGLMDKRGDTVNSSPFYAIAYRYMPLDTVATKILDQRFPPRLSPLQLDSLIGVLEARGLLGGESIHDIPASILRQRTTTSKPSAIVFVSSTCSACGTELKYLAGLRQQGIIADILVIMVGKWSGNQKDTYLKNKNIICVPLQETPTDFVDKLMVNAVPTTLVLKPNGSVFIRFDGMPPKEKLKEALIAATR